VANYVDLGGSAGARPGTGSVGSSISSGEIVNNTIRSRDVRALGGNDLGINARYGPSVTINPGTPFSAVAAVDCHPGDRVINGGYQATDGSKLFLEDDTPTSRGGSGPLDRWVWNIFNQGNAPVNFHPMAICMNN
jgi:hypothetical protein